VTTAKIADANVTQAKLAANAVATANIADNQVTTAKIADSNVTTAKIAADAVTGAKIADDQINSEHYVDGSIDTAHIAGAQVTDAKLASNSVTTSKITDANVTTVKVADANITLAKLASDLKQTTISNSDTQIPTSGAVVDYVAAQLLPFGGFEAIANEVSFPNTQPVSGVAISIADAAGIVVSGSGSSTTGRTVGGSTVTINNFPSSLNSETLAAGVGLMVSSTGSSQTYNYHKILAAEADVKTLSGDINDFAERYRVGSTNPTSSLDAGDLFFNTGSGKLLVYNGTSNAWEETQSVGNFFINTLSSSSSTGGGSATFNGSAYRFTLSNAGQDAQQMLVSINGVIQKPNSGTSQPSEGFAISSNDIIFSAAPASGADFFIITIGASVSIGTPSDGTVSTAKLASGAVTTAKIADGAVTAAKLAGSITSSLLSSDSVTTAKIADNAVTTAKIANDAVTGAKIAAEIDNSHITSSANIAGSKLADNSITLAKLTHGDGSSDGKFLRANNGADPTFETVNTDLVSDTSPQLGGDLQSNGNDIDFADSDKAIFGTGGDLEIYHDGSNSRIVDTGTGSLVIQTSRLNVANAADSEGMLQAYQDGAVEAYYNGVKKFETTSSGATVTGEARVSSHLVMNTVDDQKIYLGAGNDLQIYHDGNNSVLEDTGTGSLIAKASTFHVKSTGGEDILKGITDGAVEAYYNNNKKFETTSYGARVYGNFENHNDFITVKDAGKFTAGNSDDLQMYHDGNNSYVKHSGTGNLRIETTGDADEDIYLDSYDDIYLQVADGADAVKCEGGGKVYLYHNGTQKFWTQSWGAQLAGNFIPNGNNSHDLGASNERWRNVYTNDLHLSNEGHSNDVDGTWGNWTIQEGESDLFLKNNRSGKKYKFNLTEVS